MLQSVMLPSRGTTGDWGNGLTRTLWSFWDREQEELTLSKCLLPLASCSVIKLHQGEFRLDIGKTFFTGRVSDWALEWAAPGGDGVSIPGGIKKKDWMWHSLPWFS